MGTGGAGPQAQRWACPIGNKWNVGDEIVPDPRKIRLRRLRLGVLTAASAFQRELSESGTRFRVAFVTVTYAPGEVYEPRDISRLIRHYRQWCKRRGFRLRGVWCLELQERGAPHYHLVFWLPRGMTPPLPDKQGWWRKGLSNAVWARKPVSYLAKYASKGESGELPPGARLWGLVGAPVSVRASVAFACAPGWLRELCSDTPGAWLRRVRGWWVNPETGIRYRSPWRMVAASGGAACLRFDGWGPDDVCWPSLGWDAVVERPHRLPPLFRSGSRRGLL